MGNLAKTDNSTYNKDCEQIPRYIGQHGILSQTRKTNETTTVLNDDNTISLQLRQSTEDQTVEARPSEYSNGVDININIVEAVTIPEDVCPANDELPSSQNITKTNDNGLLSASLNITHDKTFETSSTVENKSMPDYNDNIEDTSNDDIASSPLSRLSHSTHSPLAT